MPHRHTIFAATLALLVCLPGARASAQPPQSEHAASPGAPAHCADREFSIYFDEWRSDLSAEALDAIATVQRDLEGCAIQHVRIVGLAGAKGGEDDNLLVSQARADTIAAALEAGGWPADHFEVIALGEQNALNEEGVASPMRRRAHIVIDAAPPATS